MDLPTPLEKGAITGLAAKLAWVGSYLCVYGLRPLIVRPKAPDASDLFCTGLVLGFDAAVYYFWGAKARGGLGVGGGGGGRAGLGGAAALAGPARPPAPPTAPPPPPPPIHSSDGETILEAAERLAVEPEVPNLCRSGQCFTCVSRLEGGALRPGASGDLGEDLAAAGYVLPCVAVPDGEGVLVATHCGHEV